MKKIFHPTSLPTFFLIVASIILVLEWLRPLSVISDTNYVSVFGIYFAVCILTSYFFKSKLVKFLVKASLLLAIMDYLFMQYPLLSSAWIEEWLTQMNIDFEWTSLRGWSSTAPFLRTFLFLLLLWLLSYLLHYWLVIANRFFPFIAMTIVYIAILDTFTDYNATKAIIIVAVLSMMMLIVSQYEKRVRDSYVSSKNDSSRKWIIPMFTAILLKIGRASC